MNLIETESLTARQAHPVDLIEWIASEREWSFERCCDDELALAVAGSWTEYAAAFSWMEDAETLHLGCAFDLVVAKAREGEIRRLIGLINEKLLVGHFDLWGGEGAVMYRHGLLLTGGAQPTGQQTESMLRAALENCERYYQAFQFVLWGGKSAEAALETAVFETVGEA